MPELYRAKANTPRAPARMGAAVATGLPAPDMADAAALADAAVAATSPF